MDFTKIFNAINKRVVYSLHYVTTLCIVITLVYIEMHHQIRSGQCLQAIWNLKHFPIVALAATGFVVFIILFMFMMTYSSLHNYTNVTRLEVKKRYGDFMMLRLTNEIATMENKYLRNLKPSEVIVLKKFLLDHRDTRNALETFKRDTTGHFSSDNKNLLGSFRDMIKVLKNEKEPLHNLTDEEGGDSTDDYASSDNDEFGCTYIYGRSRPFNKDRKQKKEQSPSASNDISNQELYDTSAIETTCNESSKEKLTKTKSITKSPSFQLTRDEKISNEMRNDETNFISKLTAEQIPHTTTTHSKATLQDQSKDQPIHYNLTNKKLNKKQTNQHCLNPKQAVLNESNENDVIGDNKYNENRIDPYQKIYKEVLEKIEKCAAIENGTTCNPLVYVGVVDNELDKSNLTSDDEFSLVECEKEFHNETVDTEIGTDYCATNKRSYIKLHYLRANKEEIKLSKESTDNINDDHINNQYDKKDFDDANQSKIAAKKGCLKYKISKNSQHDNKSKEDKIEMKKTKGNWESIRNNQKKKQHRECIIQQKLKHETQLKEKLKYSEKYKDNVKLKQEEKGNDKKIKANEAKKTQEIRKIGGKSTKDDNKYNMNKPKIINNYTKNEVRAIISREKTNIVINYLKADAKVKLKDKINSKTKAECNSKHNEPSKMHKNRGKEENNNNSRNIKVVRFKENDNGNLCNNEKEKQLNSIEVEDNIAGCDEVSAENHVKLE